MRYKKVYSKAAHDWVVKNIYEKKTSNYSGELLLRTLAARQDKQT